MIENEVEQLEVIYGYRILDTPAEAEFDDLTYLAANLCQTPIAIISLIDRDRYWFKSKIGISQSEVPRETAFCTQTILLRALLVVEDAHADDRFRHHPLVLGDPFIRFYAGVPLVTPDDYCIGTLCVIDTQPKQLTTQQVDALQALARQVMSQLELRRSNRSWMEREQRLQAIINAEPECLKIVDRDGTLLDINPAGLAMIGAPDKASVVGKSVYDLIAPEHRQTFQAFHHRVCGGEAETLEFDIISYSGQRRQMETHAVPLPFEHPERLVHLAVTRDVTEQKQAAVALHQTIAARQRAESVLQQQAERDRIFSAIARRIRQSLDLKEILNTTVSEIRQLLQADRVLTYRTSANGTGEVLAEAVDPNWHPILGLELPPDIFPLDFYDLYQQGRIRAVTDIEQDDLAGCLKETLRQIQVRSKVVVPILHEDYLWGLLVAHQCSGPRNWAAWEVDLLVQLADQVAIAVHQAALYQQAQFELSERRQMEVALRQSETRFRLLADNMSDLVCLHHPDGRYLYISPSSKTLLGYQPDDLIDQSPIGFVHPEDQAKLRQMLYRAAFGQKSAPFNYRFRRKTGEYLWLETLIKPIFADNGQVMQLQTASRDVTERIQFQAQLLADALHDELTSLPNRSYLLQRLGQALRQLRQYPDKRFAVLFLDLDHFKLINDSLGNTLGDQLLLVIAQKLQNLLQTQDFIARLGGDEFVILIENLNHISDAIRVADRVYQEFQNPIFVGGHELFITASIGILQGESAYRNPEDLLRDADISMHQAKKNGKGRYEIFVPSMHLQLLQRLNLETDLRKALDNQEFCLQYQPIVSLKTDRTLGFEVLLRWHHSQHGLISPQDFIPIAEETGLILPMGLWVLEAACHQMVSWQQTYPAARDLKLSVNLSARQLQGASLIGNITKILKRTQLSPQQLTLEITETILIENLFDAISLLTALRNCGIQISIDDFGTGYSSLSYLHRLPINYLKIDQAFVGQMHLEDTNHKIVETIIKLSDHLGLEAIAEGVETQQQADELQQLGCEAAQGYWFAKPLSADAVALHLQRLDQ